MEGAAARADNPAEYLTLTQAAAELQVDRSRVVQLTREADAGGGPRLPTREFFGVKVVHVADLERVREGRPGRPKREEG